jgi:hypothetical protein
MAFDGGGCLLGEDQLAEEVQEVAHCLAAHLL